MEALSPQTLGAIHKTKEWRRRLPRVRVRRATVVRAIAAFVLIAASSYVLLCPELPMAKAMAFRRLFGDHADVIRHPVSVTFYSVNWDVKDMNLDFEWDENPTTTFHGLLISDQKTVTNAVAMRNIVNYTKPVKVQEFCACAFEPKFAARIFGRDGKAVDLLIGKDGEVFILMKGKRPRNRSRVKHHPGLLTLILKAPEAE